MISIKLNIFIHNFGKKLGLNLNYFIKNGSWALFRQFIDILTGLFLTTAFARLLTEEVYGQYRLIITLVEIFSFISIPGLNTAIIRSVARGYDGDYKKVVKVSFYWSLLALPVFMANKS